MSSKLYAAYKEIQTLKDENEQLKCAEAQSNDDRGHPNDLDIIDGECVYEGFISNEPVCGSLYDNFYMNIYTTAVELWCSALKNEVIAYRLECGRYKSRCIEYEEVCGEVWKAKALARYYSSEAEKANEKLKHLEEQYELLADTEYENDIEMEEGMEFISSQIKELRDKLNAKQIEPQTEEATKQWLVMPLLVALGYNPWSSDIIPEYTLDIGIKQGEKVDYALQVNNKPVVIVECKQLGMSLSDRFVSQLYRYFSVADVKVAILTNGDDYWFFTDSEKDNIMDLKPYYQFKLSNASDSEIESLRKYCKDSISDLDISRVVSYDRYKIICENFVHSLRVNEAPDWLLSALAEQASLQSVDRPTLAGFLNQAITKEFSIKSPVTTSNIRTITATDASPIKLHYEYVYNDYSDGDWKFHTPSYVKVFDETFSNIKMYEIATKTAEKLAKEGYINKESILTSGLFNGTYRMTMGKYECRKGVLIESLGLYMETAYSAHAIVLFVNRLLKFCNLPDETVKVSFRA